MKLTTAMTLVWLAMLASLPAFIEYPPDADADGPRVISVSIGASLTSRWYCARPGVTSCADYGQLPNPPPAGVELNLRTQVPYPGVDVMAELFPLAAFFSNAAQGLGVVATFGAGYLSGGFRATELHGGGSVAFRFWFHLGRLQAYAGLRLGAKGSVFETSVLGFGTSRIFPFAGADVALRATPWLGVEASAEAFYDPVMTWRDAVKFGEKSSSTGFAVGGGLAGVIWGPFGYRARVWLEQFSDRFTGPGSTWTTTTMGAATELLVRLTGALLVSL